MKKFLLLFLLLSTFSNAEELDNCSKMQSPIFRIEYDSTKVQLLCNSQYLSYYSLQDRIPLLVVEQLDSKNLTGEYHRTNDFHEDLRIASKYRSTNLDYYHSGFDKGHLSAASNTRQHESVSESFLLSNITPQFPMLNRTTWKYMETFTINQTKLHKHIYVMSGVQLNNCEYPDKINSRVTIPDGYFKIAYVPSIGLAQGFEIMNSYPSSKKIKDYQISVNSSTLEKISNKLCNIKIHGSN